MTRQEVFILGWLIFQTRDRNYSDLMGDFQVAAQECQAALKGLFELDLLRLR